MESLTRASPGLQRVPSSSSQQSKSSDQSQREAEQGNVLVVVVVVVIVVVVVLVLVLVIVRCFGGSVAVGRRKGAHFMGGDEVVELHS